MAWFVLNLSSLSISSQGGGGGILADRLLGRDIVGAVEIEKYPREILLSRRD